MGKIFYVMGKSASGKDTIYKLLRERLPELRTVVPYTTRPIRNGEAEGVEYHFTTEESLAKMETEGKIIEKRTYQTVFGPWSYSTVNDGQIDLAAADYLMIGTLESYRNTRTFFGKDALVPLYIEVEDGERLARAPPGAAAGETEVRGAMPEILADEADFSEEKLSEAGIGKRFANCETEACVNALVQEIVRG